MSVTWLDCPWILGQSREEWPETLLWDEMDDSKHTLAKKPAQLLSDNGTFSNWYLGGLNTWFRKRIDEVKSDTTASIAVVTYSAGGYLVYRWLAELDSKSIVERIETIFCIASPYCFRPYQTVRLTIESDGKSILSSPISVNESCIEAAQIIKHLRPSQLVVLQAKEDKTVLPPYSSFQANNVEVQEIIEPLPIVGADHLTILTHDETKQHILNHLST